MPKADPITTPRRRTAPARRQRNDDGELLTSQELRERAEDARHRRELDAAAHQAWERGHVVPHRITVALDLRQLYGPEVDAACDAEEPDVDLWEAGKKYPRWDQLLLLADLTGFDVRFFVMPPDGEIHALGPGVAFICKRSSRTWNPRVEIPAPITTFTPEAIAATLTGRCLACLSPRPGSPAIHTCEQIAIPLEVS